MSTTHMATGTPFKASLISLPNTGALAVRQVDLKALMVAGAYDAKLAFIKVLSGNLYFLLSDDIAADAKLDHIAAVAAGGEALNQLKHLWGSTDGIIWSLDLKYGRYLTVYDDVADNVTDVLLAQ